MPHPPPDKEQLSRLVLDRLAFPMQNIASFLDDLLQDDGAMIDTQTRHKLILIRNELQASARLAIGELRPAPEPAKGCTKIEAA
ncbi:MAG: hypothetical protein AAGC81_12875 [Pseudomonadota bacterium]